MATSSGEPDGYVDAAGLTATSSGEPDGYVERPA
jgi:hypothetical protein